MNEHCSHDKFKRLKPCLICVHEAKIQVLRNALGAAIHNMKQSVVRIQLDDYLGAMLTLRRTVTACKNELKSTEKEGSNGEKET